MSCWVRGGHLRIGAHTYPLPALTWNPPAWPTQPTWAGLEQRIEALRAGAGALALGMARKLAAGRRVVGDGIGLTPTGDDVLLGWHAAHHALGRPLPAPDTRGTTDLSRAFLDLAVRGHIHEPLRRAVHVTLTGEPDLPARIDSLYAVGATSGRDAAAGAALGLLTLIPLKDAA